MKNKRIPQPVVHLSELFTSIFLSFVFCFQLSKERKKERKKLKAFIKRKERKMVNFGTEFDCNVEEKEKWMNMEDGDGLLT